MGSQEALGSQLFFGLSCACWFLVVKLVVPPIWHSPVPGMGFANGSGSVKQVVELAVSAPLVDHVIDGAPVFLVVVMDQAVGIALPSSVLGVGTFGSCGSQAFISPLEVCSKLGNGTGGSHPVTGQPILGEECKLVFPPS